MKITTLSCEIDIDGAAVNPSLGPIRMVQSAPRPVGEIIKTKQFTYTAGAAGEFEIADLPKQGKINKIYFGNRTGVNYSRLVIEVDNFVMFDRTASENDQVQADGVRVPQSDYLVYDPTENGNADETLALAGIQDFRLRLTLGAAGQVPLTVEYIDTPEQ